MAKPAAVAPADDETAGTDMGDDASGDTGSDSTGPTVLLTVMDNHDGTYLLIEGDEDEAGESGETDEGTGAAPAGPMGGDDQSGEAGEQGQTFDSPGALLKGILDIVKNAEESAGGEGSSDDQFQAGFAGDSPAKPSMAQKY